MLKRIVPLLLILPVTVTAQDSPVWERVVVIGASASSGYGISRGTGNPKETVTLAEVCNAMIRKDHRAVENFSTLELFANPAVGGAEQVKKALESKPSAVVAFDFLFWFAYGDEKDDEKRAKELDAGLALLEKFECPVVVSGLPDLGNAVGKALSKDQVPTEEALKKLNGRIEKWVSSRKNAILIPLREAYEAAGAGKTVKAGTSEWKEKPLEALLQKDQLHPTIEGLALIAALSFEALQKRYKLESTLFDLDAKAITAKLLKEAGGKDRPSREK